MEQLIEETEQGLRLSIKVHSPLGLHARPAARLAQEMQAFDATVTLRCQGNSADGKSILELLTLAATTGSQLTAVATGADAKACLLRLAELFSSEFKG